MFQDVLNNPALTGFGNPFYQQQSPFQGAGSPYVGAQTMGQQPYGVPGYGVIHPLAAMIAAQQHPILQAILQHPILAQQLASQLQGGIGQQGGAQYPLLQGILQHPLLAHYLGSQLQGGIGQQANPYGQQVNPYGQQTNPYGQQANPYSQQGNPWGQQTMPLAPQTWVGQGGQFGQQIHPLLAQLLATRQLGGPGIPGFGLGY